MKKENIPKVQSQGNQRFYADLRRKEKAANQRMLRLERAGLDSPAYQAIQAKLEMIGRQTKGDRGRRFSESGKATYNEMEMLNKILDDFLKHDTSTVSGAKQYWEDVWITSNENYDLDDAGISRKDWLDFWANMPDDKKDRLYGSDEIIDIMRAYTIKNGKLTDQDKMSVEEIADAIQSSKSLKGAYKSLGLTWKDIKKAAIK